MRAWWSKWGSKWGFMSLLPFLPFPSFTVFSLYSQSLSAFCVATSSSVWEVIFLGVSPVLHPWCWFAANACIHPDTSSASSCGMLWMFASCCIISGQGKQTPPSSFRSAQDILDRLDSCCSLHQPNLPIDFCLHGLWVIVVPCFKKNIGWTGWARTRFCFQSILQREYGDLPTMPVPLWTLSLTQALEYVFNYWQSISFTFDLVFALCPQKVPRLRN